MVVIKIRSSFVTNSSSSSFILAFKEKDKDSYGIFGNSYDQFKEYCGWLGYEAFYDLIDSFRKYPENVDKEQILKKLHDYYVWDIKLELIDSSIKQENYESHLEYWNARKEYENSLELKQKIQEYLVTNEKYIEQKKQIEEADLVVSGMIWDTDGGLLEWAIRNGFIEDNFGKHCVACWNVG